MRLCFGVIRNFPHHIMEKLQTILISQVSSFELNGLCFNDIIQEGKSTETLSSSSLGYSYVRKEVILK